jgi:hypothetical protein
MTYTRNGDGVGIVHSPDTPLGRFGIATVLDSPDPFIGSMPMSGLINPLTGAASVGPLAVLVDFVGGLVNHHRRTSEEWTVSTELTLEVVPDCLALLARAPDIPVVATARPLGGRDASSLGRCLITHQDLVIGIGSVRSVHIRMPGAFPGDIPSRRGGDRPTDLIDIMVLRIPEQEADSAVLYQPPNPFLANSMGMVHGGVAVDGETAGGRGGRTRWSRCPDG